MRAYRHKIQGRGFSTLKEPIIINLPKKVNVFGLPKLTLYSPQFMQEYSVQLGLEKVVVHEFKSVILFPERPYSVLNWEGKLHDYSPKYFNRVAIINTLSIKREIMFRLEWNYESDLVDRGHWI